MVLHTNEIYNKILSDDYAKISFIGVFPFDVQPIITCYPASLVFNTDPYGKNGQHWVAIYVDENKNSEFFDSFGLSPAAYGLDKYLEKLSKNYFYNQQQLQGFDSNTCGYYCIFFIKLKARGYSLKKILSFFKNEDLKYNDLVVCS